MKKILYIGWLGFNNLGDELMWEMFRDLSGKYLDPSEYQVIPSLPGVNLKDTSPYDVVVLGGGSLLIPGYIDILHQAVKNRKKTMIWGSGHDRLEKVHVNNQGKIVSDLVQSKNNQSVMLTEIMQDVAFCGIRGPLTYQYLEQIHVPMDKVRISGDPGYLLSLPHSEHKGGQSRAPIIGINWGTAYNKIYGQNEMLVEDALVRAAHRYIGEGYKIYIYAVWGPDRTACKRLYDKIGQPDQTILDLELHNCQQLMNIVQHFTMTVNFKLHANILSAAAGVPFICLGYRFKCLDFVHSLNLSNSLIPTDSPALEEDIIKAMIHAQNHRVEIVEAIEFHQEQYKKLLETPFAQQLF